MIRLNKFVSIHGDSITVVYIGIKVFNDQELEQSELKSCSRNQNEKNNYNTNIYYEESMHVTE